ARRCPPARACSQGDVRSARPRPGVRTYDPDRRQVGNRDRSAALFAAKGAVRHQWPQVRSRSQHIRVLRRHPSQGKARARRARSHRYHTKGEKQVLARRIRAGLMTAVLTLGVTLSGHDMADISSKEATELNAQAKATLTKFKTSTKGADD